MLSMSGSNEPSSTNHPVEKETDRQDLVRPVIPSPNSSISISDIVKSLEEKGLPFTHTLFEEFVGRFQTTPRQNGKLYRQFRYAMQKAEEQLAAKYNGKWESKSIQIDRKPSKQFWLVVSEGEKSQGLNRYATND